MPRILVTGVSSGLGKALAEAYARAGWSVIGTVRDPQGSDIEWAGDVHLERLDLAERGAGADLARRVLDEHGCPDVVVNNAGVLQFGPIEAMTADETERLFRINVFEQVALAYGFVPAMRERGSGTLVNVTSLGGRMTFPFFSTYNASKHALEGYSEGMWHELRPFGIRVKVIEPGFVETAIWGKVLPQRPDDLEAPEPYRRRMLAMLQFETQITNRTPSQKAAEEIVRAIEDPSDRLRYPVAAYARPILAARRLFGDRSMMRFFGRRWAGSGKP